MQGSLRTKPTAESVEASSPTPAFDPAVSRDLDLIAATDGHLRQAWRALTTVARRSVVVAGCILEIAAMLGDLASERRRIEGEAGL